MNPIYKETLFTDLPNEIKQKISNIRSLSTKRESVYSPIPLKEYATIPVFSSVGLYDEFMSLYSKIQKIGPYNAEEQLDKEIEELEMFIKLYKENIEEKDFVREIEKTVKMMEGRFQMLSKKRERR